MPRCLGARRALHSQLCQAPPLLAAQEFGDPRHDAALRATQVTRELCLTADEPVDAFRVEGACQLLSADLLLYLRKRTPEPLDPRMLLCSEALDPFDLGVVEPQASQHRRSGCLGSDDRYSLSRDGVTTLRLPCGERRHDEKH